MIASHPVFGWASGPVEVHLKVLGSAHGDEFELTLAGMLFCALVGPESAAKQAGDEQQIAEKTRNEIAERTHLTHISSTDLFC